MSEYSNGADGSCQECGSETDEEWHAFCADCFAEQQGWRPRGDNVDGPVGVAPSFPGDERWKVAYHNGYRAGYHEGFRTAGKQLNEVIAKLGGEMPDGWGEES